MAKSMKLKGAANPAVGVLAVGAAVSMAMTMVGTGICAALISAETITPSSMGYCAVGVLLVSAFAGSSVVTGVGKQRSPVTNVIAGGVYYLMLLAVTALFFDGQYQGIGVTAFAVLSGSILPTLLGRTRKNGTKLRKSKIRRR